MLQDRSQHSFCNRNTGDEAILSGKLFSIEFIEFIRNISRELHGLDCKWFQSWDRFTFVWLIKSTKEIDDFVVIFLLWFYQMLNNWGREYSFTRTWSCVHPKRSTFARWVPFRENRVFEYPFSCAAVSWVEMAIQVNLRIDSRISTAKNPALYFVIVYEENDQWSSLITLKFNTHCSPNRCKSVGVAS